jgi:hypothetical protein
MIAAKGARRRSRWPWVLLAVVVLLALVPFSRLGSAPRVRRVEHGFASGPLQAGAGKTEMAIPFPVPTVGYGWVRPEVSGAAFPVYARAVVMAVAGERVGIISLDLLLADAGLVRDIRANAAGLKLSALWVAATHTHSSAGGFAWNPVAEVAATGRIRPEVRARVIDAAVGALRAAAGSLQTVDALAGAADSVLGTASRDEFPGVDRELTRLQLKGANGPVAQVLVLAAHPTLVPRPPPGLDPDWPGRLARMQESVGQGVTLVLQGNVGNVSVERGKTGPDSAAEAFARAVGAQVQALPLVPVATGLGHSRLEVRLPGPDASRFVPWGLATVVENVALWPWAPDWAEVSEVRIGGVRLLGVPVEATAASGAVLEAVAGGARVVSLVNGYLGYVEPPDRVTRAAGESRRQLFGTGLLEALRFGTEAARAALRPEPEPSSGR